MSTVISRDIITSTCPPHPTNSLQDIEFPDSPLGNKVNRPMVICID